MGEIATYEEIQKGLQNNALKPRNRLISDLTSDFTQENENTQETLNISLLIPYSDHPFKLYEGERLNDMVRSIKEMGIILPIIVRLISKKDKTYEILSGHNRVNAAKIAGLTEVPVIIKKGLSNDEAKLIVTETNLIQRSFTDLSHSERAVSLKLHMDAIKSQGKRNDIINEIEKLTKLDKTKENQTSYLIDTKLRTNQKTGEKYGLSSASVARYIRITYLIETLQERIDNGEIGLYPAVSLSYLTQEEQTALNTTLEETSYKIDIKKAETLRTYSEKKQLTNDKIPLILSGEINKKKTPKTPPPFKLKHKIYSKYFTESTNQNEMEVIIEKALANYFANSAEKEKINES